MAREFSFGFGGHAGGSGGSSSSNSSNIRVSVRWFEQAVFAGDDVRCRITFANIAPRPQQAQSQQPRASLSPSSSSHGVAAAGQNNRSSSLTPSTTSSSLALPVTASGRGSHHRASHSIGGPPTGTAATIVPSSSSTSASAAAAAVASGGATRRRADSIPWSSNGSSSGNGNGPPNVSNGGNGGGGAASSGHGRNHRRSLSIVSISSASASDSQSAGSARAGSPPLLSSQAGSQYRPVRGHTRASSLQIGSRGNYHNGPRSATNPSRPFSTQPSPLFNSTFPSSERSGNITGLRGRLTGSATVPNTPSIGSMSRTSPRTPSDGFPDFKFPAAPAPPASLSRATPSLLSEDSTVVSSPTAMTPDDKPLPALPIRSRDQASGQIATAPLAAQVPTIYEGPPVPSEARVLSTTSIAGTPRSSGEFYSLSNHSTETLASEYVAQQPSHPGASRSHQGQGPLGASSRPLPPHARQKSSSSSLLSPPTHGSSAAHPGHSSSSPSRSLSQRARTAAAAAVAAAPETLMMGYAQIQGSFTLDGSLVNLSPFEQVKRKGVVGGQGGGVIGLETNSKRDSGLLRGFGWGSLASSIGDLLGGGELSTIKEMRDIASSKSVPLLSTPQSVLFVDLRLAPGESKTFEYTFRLPKGLPPTHRGKVMKIAYGLVIGTQRPGTAKEQRVKSVEIPFRVLGSVNNYGEILGHDLMSPYILMRDQAVIQPLSAKERNKPWTLPPSSEGGADGQQQQQQQQQVGRRRRSSTANTITEASSLSGFMLYVDTLLKQQTAETGLGLGSKNASSTEVASTTSDGLQRQRSGLLSPTAIMSGSRRASSASSIFWGDDGGGTAGSSFSGGFGRPFLSLSSREAIDLAILRSNISDHHHQQYPGGGGGGGASNNISTNRFEIARNGRKVGTVLLARPAYRLGETVTMVVDFANADIRCYAVHAALETAERIVDPSLALRSEASIQRVTRKVYASLSEATLYARRFVFTATIPASATPEFVTSGVSLDWKIRVEFVVPGDDDDNETMQQGVGDDDDNDDDDFDGGSGDRAEGESVSGYDDDDNHRKESVALSSRQPSAGHSGRPRRAPGGPRASLAPSSSSSSLTRHHHQHPHSEHSSHLGHLGRRRGPPLPPPMLEEFSRDDRGGLVLVAAETLRCESFEAAVPLRVYGWSGEVGGGSISSSGYSTGQQDLREGVTV